MHNNLSLHSNEDSASGSSTNDNASNRKQYEDKMDKQRLEHILFSGEQSGPLNVEWFIILILYLSEL